MMIACKGKRLKYVFHSPVDKITTPYLLFAHWWIYDQSTNLWCRVTVDIIGCCSVSIIPSSASLEKISYH